LCVIITPTNYTSEKKSQILFIAHNYVIHHQLTIDSTWPAYAVLTELRDWDGIKVITDYAGLPSTNEETMALAPHAP